MPTTSRRSSAYSRRRFTRSTRRGSAKTSRPTRTPPRSLYGIPVGHVKSSGSSRGGRLQLSARSGLPAYSGGDEIFVCSRAASGRVCRRIAKLSLCPRCRWFVIPSEVDETERYEQCPVDRRQPSTGEVCRVAGRGALGRRSESDGRARSSRAGSRPRPHGRAPRSDRVATARARSPEQRWWWQSCGSNYRSVRRPPAGSCGSPNPPWGARPLRGVDALPPSTNRPCLRIHRRPLRGQS